MDERFYGHLWKDHDEWLSYEFTDDWRILFFFRGVVSYWKNGNVRKRVSLKIREV